MIISHQHKYLFIEVPQTASTAISAELRLHYGGESILWKHANYTEFRRAARRHEKKYFTFAAVRNPLDTIVTAYSKLASNHKEAYTDPRRFAHNGGWIPEVHLEKFQFIQDRNADFPTFLRRYCRSPYHNWLHLRHKDFDFMMRFENIQKDFAQVLDSIGVKAIRPLPVVNKTSRAQAFEDYYSPDARELATRVFGPFMELWDYEFPPRWDVNFVPLSSKLQFKIKEEFVQFIARFLTLSEHSGLQTAANRFWK